jgi:hypothetical protein
MSAAVCGPRAATPIPDSASLIRAHMLNEKPAILGELRNKFSNGEKVPI